jgi:hypothetical protein
MKTITPAVIESSEGSGEEILAIPTIVWDFLTSRHDESLLRTGSRLGG